jgi:hypothetical protein
MAVVVNNPDTVPAHRDSGTGFLFGLILLVVVLFALFAYGLPALRGAAAPANNGFSVPSKIDVNVNQPGNVGK